MSTKACVRIHEGTPGSEMSVRSTCCCGRAFGQALWSFPLEPPTPVYRTYKAISIYVVSQSMEQCAQTADGCKYLKRSVLRRAVLRVIVSGDSLRERRGMRDVVL
eukprot:scaffold143368_cov23-Tisochrysis_lutea.AAC.1